ncbi:MAG TPA: trigger factor [Candidatus Saccharibacteria bacterium]|nr:trigger factor [Candidatus Saccharibacteria bacterium]
MKHTLKKLSDTQVLVAVTASEQDLAEAKIVALKHLARDIKVPGFRKGKVPANVAEKYLDANILSNEVVEHAINAVLNEVITIEDLRVLDQPKIELKKFVPFTEMEVEATIDVLPEITLGDYKKLKVKREVKKVAKSDIDEVLDRVKQNLAEKKEVKRVAKDGDEVILDFIGKKDSEAFEGGTATDYSLTLGSGSFIPGFEEAIVGHKKGDTFEIPLKFPKDYHAEHLKGQPVVFEVTLKKITEVTLPELTDELAAKVGPFKTVQELTDDIERELTAQNERETDEKYKDELIGTLVKKSKVPVPDVLVDDQLKSIEQDTKQNLMYRGMSSEQYMEQMGYKDEDEWREKEFKPAAVRRVQSGLVLAELSKLEKIDVKREELDARHADMLAQYPNMKEQLDAPEARRDLANRVITEKTLERLVALNS